MFSGTLRSNLEPEDTVEEGEAGTGGPKRFTLATAIEDEGNGLSAGQRSLVSLARVLLKDTRVLILDEATGTVKTSLLLWHHRKSYPFGFQPPLITRETGRFKTLLWQNLKTAPF